MVVIVFLLCTRRQAERKIFTYERGAPLNADGGLFSTCDDYARFIRFLLSDGQDIDFLAFEHGFCAVWSV
eukprot:1396281-Pyramimonas_sp.AAC.1